MSTATLLASADLNPLVPNVWESLSFGFGFVVLIPVLMLLLGLWAVIAVLRSRSMSVTTKAVLLILVFAAPILGAILALILCHQARRDANSLTPKTPAY
ncbi:hypothetical protein [Nesterenkonia sp. Act20]|uniref:hypothetical protein n=1 Tax=Nesterenkonia sp. Act20 TaxID=1483432 RepID=UPI001C4408FB|nr:hypothetical protein [Nesterenkonia sp. Act20]